jgi:diaminopimelate epimerase
MRFTKLHGAGNDFIILDNRELNLDRERLSHMALKLCARRTSIGADGLIAVVPPARGGDFAMWFYNSDGSEGEMCGNGARCLGRYGYEKGLGGEKMVIETMSGDVTAERITKRLYKIRLNDPTTVKLDMDIEAGGERFDCTYIELGYPGHPHAIIKLDDFDRRDEDALRETGRKLRFHPAFPKGANVTFCRLDNGGLKIRTFERGVEDFTLACGTGTGSARRRFPH